MFVENNSIKNINIDTNLYSKRIVFTEGLDENGNIPLVIDKPELPKEEKIKEIVAVEKRFEKTPNENIFYDKSNNMYFVWNDKKQKFVQDKTIVKIYDNAYVERKGKKEYKSTFYAPDGRELGLKSKEIMIEVLSLQKLPESWIPSGWGNFYNLHYSELDGKYYNWDHDKLDFILSEITDIAGEDYFAKGDKYYKAGYGREKDIEITPEEYFSKKQTAEK